MVAAALDQLDLRRRQRVERHPRVAVREHPVVRAPHEQHGAADADQVERRVRELRRELAAGLQQRGDVGARLAVAAERLDERALRLARVRERELAVRARPRAADQLARHGDRHREQPPDDRVLLDRVEPGRQLEPVRRDRARRPRAARSPGCSASRSARQPPSEAPAITTGSPPAQPVTRSAANASSCGQDRARARAASPRRSRAGRPRSPAGRARRARPAAGARCRRSGSSRAAARSRGPHRPTSSARVAWPASWTRCS